MNKLQAAPKVRGKDGIRTSDSQAVVPGAAQARLDAVFGGSADLLRGRFTNRQRFHGKDVEYLWCSRCTRAFPIGTYRQVGDIRHCPYAGCSGHSIVDAVDWAAVRGTNVDYPCTPLLGTTYALVTTTTKVRNSSDAMAGSGAASPDARQ